MKSKEVLRLLKIARPTLTKYIREGIIKIEVLPNKRYEYNDEDVYKLLYKGIKRKTVIYARVSTTKQKPDLNNQIELLKQFCFNRGYTLSAVYSDIASGISFEKRTEFFEMLDEILEGKIERVVITYKDRLSRVGFELFSHLFQHYNCEIIVVSEVGSQKLDSQEIFEEIVSLLHCYSMKLYSNRKKLQTLKEVVCNETS